MTNDQVKVHFGTVTMDWNEVGTVAYVILKRASFAEDIVYALMGFTGIFTIVVSSRITRNQST